MNTAILLAVAYSWTQIIVPGRIVVSAFGLNDKGETTLGLDDGTTGVYRHGKFTPLPPLPAGYTLPGATGINDAGVVVGAATAPDGSVQAFIFRGGVYTFFSQPGWFNTEARAIGDSGLVTGDSSTADGSAYVGFVYDPATNTFTDATPPGSGFAFSTTQGINKYGRLSGDGRLPGMGRYAFVWQQGTIDSGDGALAPFLERVQLNDSRQNAGRGINDSGVIVGFVGNPDGSSSGFVGASTSGYQLLAVPGAGAPNSTVCEGINNRRQVVCTGNDPDGKPMGAFIGTPHESGEDN